MFRVVLIDIWDHLKENQADNLQLAGIWWCAVFVQNDAFAVQNNTLHYIFNIYFCKNQNKQSVANIVRHCILNTLHILYYFGMMSAIRSSLLGSLFFVTRKSNMVQQHRKTPRGIVTLGWQSAAFVVCATPLYNRQIILGNTSYSNCSNAKSTYTFNSSVVYYVLLLMCRHHCRCETHRNSRIVVCGNGSIKVSVVKHK